MTAHPILQPWDGTSKLIMYMVQKEQPVGKQNTKPVPLMGMRAIFPGYGSQQEKLIEQVVQQFVQTNKNKTQKSLEEANTKSFHGMNLQGQSHN